MLADNHAGRQLSRFPQRVPASAGLLPGAVGRRLARELSEPEKFLSCLAALRDQKAPAGLTPNLLSHVSFSVFVVADERDMLDILERCAGMPFVTAETTVRGVTAAVVTGTLAQWRDAVAAGSVHEAEPSVRAGFNKVYGLFCGAGLNVWGDYRTREAPDRTLLLEYKPQR